MLRAIRVTNFKAFGETQEIPIRPITLIYGPNSAGKSSILHALAYAHHASRTGELDVHKTELGGQLIDLGGFRQFIHRRNIENVLTLEFLLELQDAGETWTVEASVSISFDTDLDQATAKSYSFVSGGTPVLAMRGVRDAEDGRDRGRIIVENLDVQHPLFQKFWLDACHERRITYRGELVGGEALDHAIRKVDARRQRLFPDVIGIDRQALRGAGAGRQVPTGQSPPRRLAEDEVGLLEHAALLAIKNLVNRVTEEVTDALDNLAYIGPLRDYPERDLLFRFNSRRAAAGTGSDAWQTLAFDAAARTDVNKWLGADHMSTPYRLDAHVLAAAVDLAAPLTDAIVGRLSPLNEYEDRSDDELSRALADEASEPVDRVGARSPRREAGTTGGRPRALGAAGRSPQTGRYPAGTQGSFFPDKQLSIFPDTQGSFLPEATDLLGKLQPSVLLPFLRDAITLSAGESASRVVSLALVDCAQNTTVSLRDVGVGISQVLPVLAYSLAKKNAIVAIEQPELHLHPALQAELGDLFIESAMGAQSNRFILETHSEHLMLRIQRRLREANTKRAAGSDSEPIEDAEAASPNPATMRFRWDNVAVLFVRPRANGSEVCLLELDEEGEFTQRWPGGFFAERVTEML